MEMMERYIYAVTKYLPEAQREDVAMELSGNILDMLPESPSEEEARVQVKMGDWTLLLILLPR